MNTPVILLVEDDRNDVFFMRRALEQAGVRAGLRIVSDGEEAMDYLTGHGKFADRSQFPLPSLLLLDLKMPLANGFDVLAWLHSQPTLDYLPAIVLTSSPEDRDREKAAELGAARYFIKPPSPEMVTEMIPLMKVAPTPVRESSFGTEA
jgi:CheY-like chemotaxis protein